MARFNELYDQVVLYTENTMYMEGSIDFKAKIKELKDWGIKTFNKAKTKVITAAKSDNVKSAKAAVLSAANTLEAKTKALGKDLKSQASKMKTKLAQQKKKLMKEAAEDVPQALSSYERNRLNALNSAVDNIDRNLATFDELEMLLTRSIRRIKTEMNTSNINAEQCAATLESLTTSFNKLMETASKVYTDCELLTAIEEERDSLARKNYDAMQYAKEQKRLAKIATKEAKKQAKLNR